jgi:uncharacterized protein (DUF2267 family)
MSATGLDVFDRTLQTTNTWLGEIMQQIGPDRQVAWKVLGVVLHKLRDRLPVELSAHLGSQLPLLVRGLYYDQYRPAGQPSDCRTLDAFVAEVAEWLSDSRPVDPKLAVEVVFRTLSRHVPRGQIDKVRSVLPGGLRAYWENLEETEGPPPQDSGRATAAEI